MTSKANNGQAKIGSLTQRDTGSGPRSKIQHKKTASGVVAEKVNIISIANVKNKRKTSLQSKSVALRKEAGKFAASITGRKFNTIVQTKKNSKKDTQT